jgi:hypothetical protein
MPNSGHHIDYERLSQDAMRGIVRVVLERVIAEDGLPGNHHFYIAFNTRAEGVGLSKRLRDQYPEEMTIVLQHRFWDLSVHDDRFEVKLTFNSIPERLVVPWRAVKVFYDPTVPFGLQFEHAALTDVARKETPARPGGGARLTIAGEEDGSEADAPSAPAPKPPALAAGKRARPRKANLTSVPATIASSAGQGNDGDGDDDGSGDGGGASKPSAEVVKLDRFRKK